MSYQFTRFDVGETKSFSKLRDDNQKKLVAKQQKHIRSATHDSTLNAPSPTSTAAASIAVNKIHTHTIDIIEIDDITREGVDTSSISSKDVIKTKIIRSPHNVKRNDGNTSSKSKNLSIVNSAGEESTIVTDGKSNFNTLLSNVATAPTSTPDIQRRGSLPLPDTKSNTLLRKLRSFASSSSSSSSVPSTSSVANNVSSLTQGANDSTQLHTPFQPTVTNTDTLYKPAIKRATSLPIQYTTHEFPAPTAITRQLSEATNVSVEDDVSVSGDTIPSPHVRQTSITPIITTTVINSDTLKQNEKPKPKLNKNTGTTQYSAAAAAPPPSKLPLLTNQSLQRRTLSDPTVNVNVTTTTGNDSYSGLKQAQQNEGFNNTRGDTCKFDVTFGETSGHGKRIGASSSQYWSAEDDKLHQNEDTHSFNKQSAKQFFDPRGATPPKQSKPSLQASGVIEVHSFGIPTDVIDSKLQKLSVSSTSQTTIPPSQEDDADPFEADLRQQQYYDQQPPKQKANNSDKNIASSAAQDDPFLQPPVCTNTNTTNSNSTLVSPQYTPNRYHLKDFYTFLRTDQSPDTSSVIDSETVSVGVEGDILSTGTRSYAPSIAPPSHVSSITRPVSSLSNATIDTIATTLTNDSVSITNPAFISMNNTNRTRNRRAIRQRQYSDCMSTAGSIASTASHTSSRSTSSYTPSFDEVSHAGSMDFGTNYSSVSTSASVSRSPSFSNLSNSNATSTMISGDINTTPNAKTTAKNNLNNSPHVVKASPVTDVAVSNTSSGSAPAPTSAATPSTNVKGSSTTVNNKDSSNAPEKNKVHDTSKWLHELPGLPNKQLQKPKNLFTFTIPSQPTIVHHITTKHYRNTASSVLNISYNDKVIHKKSVNLSNIAKKGEKYIHRIYLYDSIVDVVVQHLVDNEYAYDCVVDGISVRETHIQNKIVANNTPRARMEAKDKSSAASKTVNINTAPKDAKSFVFPEFDEKKIIKRERQNEMKSLMGYY